jgi:hypothetical protein
VLALSDSGSKVKQSYDCATGRAINEMTSSKIQVDPEDLCEINKRFPTVAIDHAQFDISARSHKREALPLTVWTKPQEMVNTGQLKYLYQNCVSFVPSEDSKDAKHKMVRDHKEHLEHICLMALCFTALTQMMKINPLKTALFKGTEDTDMTMKVEEIPETISFPAIKSEPEEVSYPSVCPLLDTSPISINV